jgi:hypothetical protein
MRDMNLSAKCVSNLFVCLSACNVRLAIIEMRRVLFSVVECGHSAVLCAVCQPGKPYLVGFGDVGGCGKKASGLRPKP